ncbi:uncharacterized protein TNCV_672961 [Trichonephila clavipes]|nr:uncharacterized protein TNCV_672961 [Trichonephila clavipes]
MTSYNHMCCHSCNDSQVSFFIKTMIGLTRQVCVTNCLSTSLACPIPKFISNQAYLGSFGTVNWAFHDFDRTRGKVTENMERNVSRHHKELVCINARMYRIVRSR